MRYDDTEKEEKEKKEKSGEGDIKKETRNSDKVSDSSGNTEGVIEKEGVYESQQDKLNEEESVIKDENFKSFIIVHALGDNIISENCVVVSMHKFAEFIIAELMSERLNHKFIFVDKEGKEFLERHNSFISKISQEIVEMDSETLFANLIITKSEDFKDSSEDFDAATLTYRSDGGENAQDNSSDS